MRKIYQKGFTLIELMIVITVIAILAAIVLFGLGQAQKAAKDTQREAIIKGVQVALQSFSGDNNGTYPSGADWTTVTNASGISDASRLGTTYLPNPLTDPGCGPATGGDMRGGFDAGDPGVPTGCTSTQVLYAYVTPAPAGKCVGAAYQISLTKESGGILVFCGPK